MTKTVVIHQPDFAPYLGFFDRFRNADLFIALDHVQFVHSNRSWTHRDKIKTPAGEKWLTLSVKKAPRDTPINMIELAKPLIWIDNHLNLLRQNYSKADFFEEVFPYVNELYKQPPSLMIDLNLRSIEMLCSLLDVKIPIVLSSDLKAQGRKNELLVDILKKVGASHYLSGIGAKDYMEPEKFQKENIEIIWQNFSHPSYNQQFGKFIPQLSALDLLFNCGIKKSREIMKNIK